MVIKRTMEIKNSETPSLEIKTYRCPLNLSALPILHPILYLPVTYLICGICWGLLRVLLSSYKTKANMWSVAWHLGLSSVWSIQASLQSKFPYQWTSESHPWLPSTSHSSLKLCLVQEIISFDLNYKAFPAAHMSLGWGDDKVLALCPCVHRCALLPGTRSFLTNPGPPSQGWPLPHWAGPSSVNKQLTKHPTDYPEPHLMEAIPQLGLPFLGCIDDFVSSWPKLTSISLKHEEPASHEEPRPTACLGNPWAGEGRHG